MTGCLFAPNSNQEELSASETHIRREDLRSRCMEATAWGMDGLGNPLRPNARQFGLSFWVGVFL